MSLCLLLLVFSFQQFASAHVSCVLGKTITQLPLFEDGSGNIQGENIMDGPMLFKPTRNGLFTLQTGTCLQNLKLIETNSCQRVIPKTECPGPIQVELDSETIYVFYLDSATSIPSQISSQRDLALTIPPEEHFQDIKVLNAWILGCEVVIGFIFLFTFLALFQDSYKYPSYILSNHEAFGLSLCCRGSEEVRIRRLCIFVCGMTLSIWFSSWTVYWSTASDFLSLLIMSLTLRIYFKLISNRSEELVAKVRIFRILLHILATLLFLNVLVAIVQAASLNSIEFYKQRAALGFFSAILMLTLSVLAICVAETMFWFVRNKLKNDFAIRI